MSAHPVAFVGGPVEAAGFALAGIDVFAAACGEEQATFDRARAGAKVILLAASCAARLPSAVLERALAAAAPITTIVPAASNPPHALDPVERARRTMGFES